MGVTEDTKNTLPAVIDFSGRSTASAGKGGSTPASASKVDCTVWASGDAGGDKTRANSNASASGSEGSPSNSNAGFTEVKSKLYSKTAEFLAYRRAHGSASLHSYYLHLDVIENQSAFNNTSICWNEMFFLGINPVDQTNVVKYENIRKKIEEMRQEILFEFFCHKSIDAWASIWQR